MIIEGMLGSKFTCPEIVIVFPPEYSGLSEEIVRTSAYAGIKNKIRIENNNGKN
jgi:hypothetical protein